MYRTRRMFSTSQLVLGTLPICTKCTTFVNGIQKYEVSSSGQMSLPATARHRWQLDHGGPVDVIDLGYSVLTLPRGDGQRLLSDLLSKDAHEAFVKSLANDSDLATT